MKKFCKCGCNTQIEALDKRNRPRYFSKGHRMPVNPFDKVLITPKCWYWTAARIGTGYGHFYKNSSEVHHLSHRYFYELKYGKIPNGLYACHTCDNRWCVNPDHIFIGTAGDNNRDRFVKIGRKLSYPIAEFIRKTYQNNDAELARKYKVHADSIDNIIKNKTWVK